ncbi:MAG: hypothetical protein KDE19_19560 [Caldilineaceae bacterium]|nr:hypothetical protein [Caldilineaceae bacterium]
MDTDTASADRPQLLWFWLLWILASAVGGAVTGFLEAGRFQFLATLVLMGFFAGFVQWLVLQPYVSRAFWWFPATGIGMVLGNILQILLRPVGQLATLLHQQIGLWEVFWLNGLLWPIVFAATGLLQWLVLRFVCRFSVGTGWWILLSIGAGVLYGTAGATFCYAGCDAISATLNAQVSTALTYAMSWAVYALGSGWFLARLIQRNRRSQVV